MKFLELEGAYLVIGTIVLIITAYVSTRPFMGKNAFKVGMISVFAFLSAAIALHFYVTTDRMDDVESRFSAGKPIICESRAQRKVAQSIVLSQDQGWNLENNIFTNKEYSRGFHSARCLEHFTKAFPE